MRRFFPLTLVLCIVALVAQVTLAAPKEKAAPQDKAAAKSQVTRSTEGHQAAPAKDPNYRFYNGQWWYWIARDKNWMVWTGGKWVPYQPQASRGAYRSFSYADDAAFGPMTSPVYDSTSGGRIIGSFGMRPAASKALGNF